MRGEYFERALEDGPSFVLIFFFFNDTATTEIYTLSLHDALPIYYIAVNISSPNTARLRELQGRDGLERILGTLLEERRFLEARHGKRVPLLVKVAPDLTPEQISALARDLRSLEVDGAIATNTTTDRTAVINAPAAAQAGGLSGAPLHPLSMRVISQLRAELGAGFPLIGVGGIVSAEPARATLRAGANLIQIYTGFAYRGSPLLAEIIDALPT